jgi:hypothetical protein
MDGVEGGRADAKTGEKRFRERVVEWEGRRGGRKTNSEQRAAGSGGAGEPAREEEVRKKERMRWWRGETMQRARPSVKQLQDGIGEAPAVEKRSRRAPCCRAPALGAVPVPRRCAEAAPCAVSEAA